MIDNAVNVMPPTKLSETDQDILKRFAAKYIWWKTPEETVGQPERVMAQVMNLGDYDDVRLLENHFGDARLGEVIAHTEIGWFNERSWTYWHYRLGLALPGEVPAMPRRRVA